jgi:hypothetical protein
VKLLDAISAVDPTANRKTFAAQTFLRDVGAKIANAAAKPRGSWNFGVDDSFDSFEL